MFVDIVPSTQWGFLSRHTYKDQTTNRDNKLNPFSIIIIIIWTNNHRHRKKGELCP